ncbi:MAG TPA: FAD-dependent oxidoreductase, partial [Desulfobacterales bacterium]|nr:FAD-dependent oxidoreductase [Desulfobacterales bacterium]
MESLFEEKFDVAVLGGGPGGYVAAIRVSQLGGKVVLIECDKLGGTCVNRGCIPTKALLESVKVYNSLKNAGSFGINVDGFSIDVKAVMERAERISSGMAEKISVLMEKKGVKVIHGLGRIKDFGVIDVVGKGRVKAEKLILAPGSLPMKPPIPGVDGKGVITSDEALRLEDPPRRLAVIGGGVVGLEFSSIFAGMGVDVTVIEMMPHVLPGEDEEMSDYLCQLMRE